MAYLTPQQALIYHQTGSLPAQPVYDNSGALIGGTTGSTSAPVGTLSPNQEAALGEIGVTPSSPYGTHLGSDYGGGAQGGGVAGSTTESTPADEDALAYLTEILRRYGLESLASWAYQQLVAGHSATMILQELRDRPEYKQRFPGMEARRAARLPAISEAEYISYETTARQLMRAAGLPSGFYDDPTDFANFLGRDISVSELQSRIQDGYAAATSAPAETRDELHRLYGVDLGGLAAYYLDPDRALPVLQRQFASAQIGGASQRSGFGALAASEAERLAALGVTDSRAQEGFGTLIDSRELFGSLPGELGADTIGRDQQLGAVFEGNAAAAAAIRRQGRTRAAVFQGGGSFAAGQAGVAGLGTADSA